MQEKTPGSRVSKIVVTAIGIVVVAVAAYWITYLLLS